MDYTKYFEIADAISLQASDYLRNNFGPIKKVHHKSDTHFGIEDDILVDNLYRDYLTIKSPEVSLFTEEGDKELGNMTWIVDPIEGTSNYGVGNPFFATQICLLVNSDPVLSIVDAPMLNQRFTAIKGNGSFLNGKALKMENSTDLSESLISLGKGTKEQHLKWVGEFLSKIMIHARSLRIMGSTGLEMSYVAAGLFDLHVNYGSQPYDIAPGSLIIKESGGKVLNKYGKDWTIKDDFVIACNKNMAPDVLKYVV